MPLSLTVIVFKGMTWGVIGFYRHLHQPFMFITTTRLNEKSNALTNIANWHVKTPALGRCQETLTPQLGNGV